MDLEVKNVDAVETCVFKEAETELEPYFAKDGLVLYKANSLDENLLQMNLLI